MNYLRQRKKKRIWLVFSALALITLVFAAYYLSPPKFATQTLHTAGIPFWRIHGAISASARDTLSFFQSKDTLIETNRALEIQLHRLQMRLNALSLVEEEYELLTTSLRRGEERGVVLAAVLSRPNVSPYDTFVVDAGESEGVRPGDWLVFEGIVLGEVSDVYESTSIATLFSSPGQELEVVIGPSNTPATARGKGGGNFEVVLPRGVDVEVGDLVSMPGINPLFFGTVEELVVEPADSFQAVLFKNPVNMSSVYFVEILSR